MSAKHKTWVPQNLLGGTDNDKDADKGIGPVVVIRPRGGDRVDVGFFLVDRFCLGVKDAWFDSMELGELESAANRMFPDGRVEKSGAWGRKFVESAVAYAKELGIAPAADYKKGARVFGGVRAEDCDETFSFGHNGKPLYIQGPNDTPQRAEQVVALLRQKCGEDGFEYILAVMKPDDFDDDWDDDDDDWEDGVPMYRAEQTGGGPPCKDLQKVLKHYAKHPNMLDEIGELEYGEDLDEVAVEVREFVGILEKSFSQGDDPGKKTPGELREFSVFAADLLLKTASAPPSMRELLLDEMEMESQLKETILEMIAEPAMREMLDWMLHPHEEIRRIFFEVGLDHDSPLNKPPRVWTIFLEVENNEVLDEAHSRN